MISGWGRQNWSPVEPEAMSLQHAELCVSPTDMDRKTFVLDLPSAVPHTPAAAATGGFAFPPPSRYSVETASDQPYTLQQLQNLLQVDDSAERSRAALSAGARHAPPTGYFRAVEGCITPPPDYYHAPHAPAAGFSAQSFADIDLTASETVSDDHSLVMSSSDEANRPASSIVCCFAQVSRAIFRA